MRTPRGFPGQQVPQLEGLGHPRMIQQLKSSSLGRWLHSISDDYKGSQGLDGVTANGYGRKCKRQYPPRNLALEQI